MKRIIKFILMMFLFFVLVGCEKNKTNNLQVYLDNLVVQNEITYDFYVPRILNGEGDHIITWTSSNEKIVSIGNIISITGLEYYIVEVHQDDKTYNITLTAQIDMIDGTFEKKEFNIVVLEDLTIKEEKTKYIKEIIKQYNNMIVKDSVKLPIVTERYGFEIVWKSNNEEVMSSSGEYKSPTSDVSVVFDVTVLYNQSVFYEDVVTFLVVNKNIIEKEVMLDFVSNFGNFSQSWDSSYIERSVENSIFDVDIITKIIFSRADKQSGTITDRPVMATKASTEYVTISLGDNTFKKIEFSLTQWTTKTFDGIYIEYFNGTSWIKCSDEFTVPGIISAEITVPNINAVRLTFRSNTNKNVQMGLEYIKFEIN